MAPRTRKAATAASANGEPSRAQSPKSDDAQTESSVESVLAVALQPSTEARDPVKVNNASATEMKHGCDDALKRFLSRPELFKQIYTHTDVRLGLGWASVFIAGGTGFYGYKVDFERAKPLVWAGVILYLLLTTLQTLYAYFIEGDIVFVGKRKTFDKRIVTERITVSSTTKPSTPATPPAYAVTISYVRSTSGGKSLLGRGRAEAVRGYNTFFDERGFMDHDGFERWVGGLVGQVMDGKAE